MKNRPKFHRRNYFINKKFQIDFSIKILIVIVIESILAIGLFLYLAKGTLTTGYIGSEFSIAHTNDFFLPILLISNLIVVGITGIIAILVMLFLSHRIAGPLYHFQKVLNEISTGDLTHRFTLRHTDQFPELADHINKLIAVLDNKIGDIKLEIISISDLISEIQTGMTSKPYNDKTSDCLKKLSEKLLKLQDATKYFKTSQAQKD